MSNSSPDDLLTTSEVSELTGWSVTSVNRWALSGDLPAERKLPGRTGSYLFRRDTVQARLRVRSEVSALVTESASAATP